MAVTPLPAHYSTAMLPGLWETLGIVVAGWHDDDGSDEIVDWLCMRIMQLSQNG